MLVTGCEVGHVVGSEVLEAALACARQMAAHPGGALRVTKQLLTAARSTTVHEALSREEEMLRELSAGAEHREAVAAFLGKRSR